MRGADRARGSAALAVCGAPGLRRDGAADCRGASQMPSKAAEPTMSSRIAASRCYVGGCRKGSSCPGLYSSVVQWYWFSSKVPLEQELYSRSRWLLPCGALVVQYRRAGQASCPAAPAAFSRLSFQACVALAPHYILMGAIIGEGTGLHSVG